MSNEQVETVNDQDVEQKEESLLSQDTFDLTLLLPAPSYLPASLLHPTTFSTFLPSPAEPQERVTIVQVGSESYVSLHLAIAPLETIRELRQSLLESDEGRWLPANCGFTKSEDGTELIGEWNEIGKIWNTPLPVEGEKRVLKVIETPLTEPASRLHVQKVHDFITSTSSSPGATPSGTDYGFIYDPNALAIGEGLTVFPNVRSKAIPKPPLFTAEEEEEKIQLNGHAGKKGKGKSKTKQTDSSPELPATSDPLAQAQEKIKSFCTTSCGDASPFQFYVSSFPDPPQVSSLPPYLRSFSLSPWNPPPHPLRLRKGHHFYIHALTMEGDNLHITSHAGGYIVNRSDNVRFDPSPRGGQKTYPTLWDLFCSVSPAFKTRLNKSLEILNEENLWLLTGGGGIIPDDPPLTFFSKVAIPTYPPAHPFLVPQPQNVFPDGARMQLPYLQGLKDPAIRDWNEELVSCREMPRSKPAERLMRERMKARVMWELREEIVRGVQRIGRGEMESLVPFNEVDDSEKDAEGDKKVEEHTYVWNGVLYVKAGGDGAQFKGYLGGDEAARVAAGKDLRGAETCEELDIGAVSVGEQGEKGIGLQTLGTSVVDFMGERWVGQSLLPGILWRAKEDEETINNPEKGFLNDKELLEGNQEPPQTNFRIIYGLADPDDVESTKVNAAPWFEERAKKVAELFRVDRHSVEQPDGTSKELALSREVHGLLGTDGRTYLIDLYRLYPMDIEWLENDLISSPFSEVEGDSVETTYPHRMTLLRPELLDRYVLEQIKKPRVARALAAVKEAISTEEKETTKETEQEINLRDSISEAMGAPISPSASEQGKELVQETPSQENEEDSEALPRFNTDAYLDRVMKDEILKPLSNDELAKESQGVKNVRAAAKFLRNDMLKEFILETALTGTVDYDGLSLSQRLHAKGINMRYLGKLVASIEEVKLGKEFLEAKYEMDFTLQLLRAALIREMVVRASKHLLRKWFRSTDRCAVANMISHFFNCLLTPTSTCAKVTPDFDDLPNKKTSEWMSATRESVWAELATIIATRFRFILPTDYFEAMLPRAPILREICKRMNIQLALREYKFEWEPEDGESEEQSSPILEKVPLNGQTNGHVNGVSKKKGKKGKKEVEKERKPNSVVSPEDVINITPVVKSVLHKSRYADIMFEQGRIAFLRGHLEAGQELLQDALTYHEQVFGPVHPTMAGYYGALAMLYHQQGREHFRRVQAYEALQLEVARASTPELKAAVEARLAELKVENPDILKLEAENYIHTSIKMMRQAVVISERANGIDAYETAQIYQELAAIELSVGNFEIGIQLATHTLQLMEAIYGKGHPDQLKVVNSASIIVQQLLGNSIALPLCELQTNIARDIYERPSAIPAAKHESILPHPTYGSNLYTLGQLHAILGDLSASVKYCNQALKIFEVTFGSDSRETNECRNLLELAMKTGVDRKKSEKERLLKRGGDRLDAIRSRLLREAEPAEKEIVRPFSTAVGDISVEALASWVNGGSLPTAPNVSTTRPRTSSMSKTPTPTPKRRNRGRGKK